MIKYKWCACDMDGTLLNSKGYISRENEIAIKRLQKNGIEVIIASGRVDLMVKSFIKQLDLKGAIISCNGGLIRNIETGEIIYSKVIDKVKVRKVMDYCLGNKVSFLLYTSKIVYSSQDNSLAEKYENLNKLLTEDLRTPIKYIDNTIIEIIDKIDVIKILLVCNNREHVKLLEKHFIKLEGITIISSVSGLLDIMESNVSKGNALKILSKKLGVDLSEVIAFGDNYNDLEMLQCVGMPIAMGNSPEKVKLEAKYVTKSNNDDGVAHAINNLIFSD